MIDLHIHTNALPYHSTWEPEALVDAALQAGLHTIAVTDHNTTAGVAAVQVAGQRRGLRVISGVEIDSSFAAHDSDSPVPINQLHTLVYGVSPDNPALIGLCNAVFERNLHDAARLRGELVRRGFRLEAFDMLGRAPNVAEVALALARANPIDKQPGEDDESAGMRYILTQVPGGYQPVDVGEIIMIAHNSGGIAVLAHPGRSKGIYAIPAVEEEIRAMATLGLDGIEVYYPTHSAEQRRRYEAIAQDLGLLISGGSDSHHPHQPLAQVPTELATILQKLSIPPFQPTS